MKKLFKISITCIVITLFSSCQKEVPVPKELSTNSKLVLFAEFKANNDTVFFMMNRSIPIFKDGNVVNPVINIDTVTISNNQKTYIFNKNEVFIKSKIVNTTNIVYNYYVIIPSTKVIEGINYKIEVTTDKKEKVSGNTTIPSYLPTTAKISFDSIKIENLGSTSNNTEYDYILQFEFLDKASEKNYYMTNCYKINKISNNSSLKDSISIISDLNFDGKVLFSDIVSFASGIKFVYNDYLFTLSAIDENYYKHLKALKNYSGDDPFSEPQNLYSNITGGLGCVYSSNLKPVTLTIKK